MPRFRLLATLALLVVVGAAASARRLPLHHPPPAPRPRGVILFVGEGMGPALVYAARVFKALPAPGSGGAIGTGQASTAAPVAVGRLAMDQMPWSGTLDNHSADALVTDAAAAATALSTGVRVPAHALAQTAEGSPLPTILEQARDRGLATGVVTTLTITNATPAAFVTHGNTRMSEAALATQYVKAGVDVLLGGGQMFFYPPGTAGGSRADARNLALEMQQKGYALAVTPAELRAHAGAPRLLGLFAPGALSYDLDRDPSREPPLADMTDAALQSLSANRKGFFLLVHAGRIDWAAHDNDLAAAIHDVLALDHAVAEALRFARRHPGVLVVVTNNLETGGLAFPPGFSLAPLAAVRASVEHVLRRLGASRMDPNLPAFEDAIRTQLGLELDVPQREQIKQAGRDALRILRIIADAKAAALGVSFAGHDHTALPSFVSAQGADGGQLAGYHDITDVYAVMKRALEL